jgi:two-component sensor histidine kinase
MMNIDTAIPLGLIVNELISNIYKHAFVSKEKVGYSPKEFLAFN